MCFRLNPVVPLLAMLLVPGLLGAEDRYDFFERKIRPVLVEHCYECHSEKSSPVQGGLRLDSRPAARAGGDTGSAVVPGDPSASLLLAALRYEDFEMPPAGKLPDHILHDFERWIATGAADPREASPGARHGETSSPQPMDVRAAQSTWTFQVPRAARLPELVSSRASTRVDALIERRVQDAGLSMAESADRRTLLRRVAFDLTGLPPTVDEVQAFLTDQRPGAFERVVERLLSSPRYGERWARPWLDVARYAEDQAHIVGNNKSLFYPNAYLYRAWVIDAFNRDLPYDVFVREQLAADLIAPDRAESHVALGFLGLGPKYYRRSAPEVMADEWEDRVDTVTRGLLGLTVACARCHDHKYDPIPTRDYYALAGVFASTEMFNRPLKPDAKTNDNGHAKEPSESMHIVRDVEPRDLKVFIRGDIEQQGALAPRGYLHVLSDRPLSFTEGSGRRQLAEVIASRQNPLTARVIVNRVWGELFGRPIVASPSNFGQLGSPPTHPDLLDDLAVRFMDNGWSLKWLQREIVLSETYQQASAVSADRIAADPANQWLARMNRKRLSVEAWRDAVLTAADELSTTMGGPSMNPQQPDTRQRTLYSSVSRLELNPMLAVFDFPDPNAHSARRVETTTALQKLFVLNSPFMNTQAERFATRILQSASDSVARIEWAYHQLYSRPPAPFEIQVGLSFVEETGDWQRYAQVLLAANEMMYLD